MNTKRLKIEVYGNFLFGMGTVFYIWFFGKFAFFEGPIVEKLYLVQILKLGI
jgi:hypothetical protein